MFVLKGDVKLQPTKFAYRPIKASLYPAVMKTELEWKRNWSVDYFNNL